ncbi:MAG: ACP S-malonyltransferase [Gammaproteobacteria bacterium]
MSGSKAIVFPGQGSQSVGMLSVLADAHSLVGDTFAEASEVLGYDLWSLCQNGPEADLNQTDKTQPALLTAGVAVWRCWRDAGGAVPVAMAGHSLGEYTALVCAGSLQFADAVTLVAERGRLMQQAMPAGEGAMAAVLGLEDEAVREVCAEAAGDDVVSAANFNSPGQVVIAGSDAAVDRAIELAKGRGAKRAVKLAVSVPSHCALMRPAAEGLAERLANIEIASPEIPVFHNVDAASHTDPAAIRDALVRQLDHSVLWVDVVASLKATGADAYLEAGPGKVLTGLARRIDKTFPCQAVFDPETLDAALTA